MSMETQAAVAEAAAEGAAVAAAAEAAEAAAAVAKPTWPRRHLQAAAAAWKKSAL